MDLESQISTEENWQELITDYVKKKIKYRAWISDKLEMGNGNASDNT